MKKSSTTRKVPLSMTHRASGPGFVAPVPWMPGEEESDAAGTAGLDWVMVASSVGVAAYGGNDLAGHGRPLSKRSGGGRRQDELVVDGDAAVLGQQQELQPERSDRAAR